MQSGGYRGFGNRLSPGDVQYINERNLDGEFLEEVAAQLEEGPGVLVWIASIRPLADAEIVLYARKVAPEYGICREDDWLVMWRNA